MRKTLSLSPSTKKCACLATVLWATHCAVADLIEITNSQSAWELGDNFGHSVAVSGDTAVIGNPNHRDGHSSVFVFVRDAAGSWSQQARLEPSSPSPNRFGTSVAAFGDTVVVGAPWEDDSSGAAYVFARNGDGTWRQQGHLKASNAEGGGVFGGDFFGGSVAVSGDTVVVGAAYEDSGSSSVNGDEGNYDGRVDANFGAAYVFVRNENEAWSQQAYLKASNADFNDLFGESVALSGDTVLVGAPLEDGPSTGVNGDEGNHRGWEFVFQAGAAYVFVRDLNGAWSQQAYLKAPRTRRDDFFGQSVALSGDTIVVGAPSRFPIDSGAAYVFARESSGAWNQQARLKAGNQPDVEEFGSSVAVSGDTVVVGEPLNRSTEDFRPEAGAAYIFSRDKNGQWGGKSTVNARERSFNGLFGNSVSVSDGILLVGAPGHNNGHGAAYVLFPLPPNFPSVPLSINRIAGQVEIKFSGTLQQSVNLSEWTDIVPRPTSPYRVSSDKSLEFFRSRE